MIEEERKEGCRKDMRIDRKTGKERSDNNKRDKRLIFIIRLNIHQTYTFPFLSFSLLYPTPPPRPHSSYAAKYHML